MILLAVTATTSLVNASQGTILKEEQVVLQPVLPGVNLPQSHLTHYFATIFICTVFHELGHAIAAIKY